MKHKLFGIMVFAVCIITAVGCAPSMQVPITRPAEINLRGIKRIAIGDVSGQCGSEISDLLSSKLFESGKFDVLDRANLDKIMKEHNLQLSGAVDEKTAAEMGKVVGAASLVFGNVTMCKYDEKKTYDKPWKDKDGKGHQNFYVTGTAKVTATLKVVGMQTGKMLAVKTISKEGSKQNEADGGWPESPDGDAVMSSTRQATVDAFMKMIAPYTEYVTVKFAKNDSKVPEMEKGVEFAKRGQWGDALELFKTAVKNNPTHKGAYYDLGLAYEYSSMFKEADSAFKEANKIEACAECMDEIANCSRMAAERKKLEEQGAI